MANFAKRGSQSKRGWDEKSGVQVIPAGSNSEISLYGGGHGGVDLDVSADDPTICTSTNARCRACLTGVNSSSPR